MKRLMPLLLLAGCTATRMTHYRSGWNSCRAVDPNVIQCGNTQVAEVECFTPGEESCGALAVSYSDGERVFLWRPAGFEPGQEGSLDPGAVLRPELSSDGTKIWFRPAQARRDAWTVYEPQTGITTEVDAFRIFQIREKDPHSMPLWIPPPAK